MSLAFVRENHLWPGNSPHKGPVMQQMFPFDDVIMHFLYIPIISFKLSKLLYSPFNVLCIWPHFMICSSILILCQTIENDPILFSSGNIGLSIKATGIMSVGPVLLIGWMALRQLIGLLLYVISMWPHWALWLWTWWGFPMKVGSRLLWTWGSFLMKVCSGLW